MLNPHSKMPSKHQGSPKQHIDIDKIVWLPGFFMLGRDAKEEYDLKRRKLEKQSQWLSQIKNQIKQASDPENLLS